MKFHVVTLFPEMFESVLTGSILGRAIGHDLIEVDFVNPRDFARDAHRTVDAPPYGGGPGMVMMAPPLVDAVESIWARYPDADRPQVVMLSPQGVPFDQSAARSFAARPSLILVCGRYEGVDERFVEQCVDLELSVGDFVLTGGEIAAMAVIDAVARLVPGVLGDDDSSHVESFSAGTGGKLEAAVYTRPATYRGQRVPEVLLSGDHAAVEQFRRTSSAERTLKRRPDLMEGWTPQSGDEHTDKGGNTMLG